jgi:hypothetical protein
VRPTAAAAIAFALLAACSGNDDSGGTDTATAVTSSSAESTSTGSPTTALPRVVTTTAVAPTTVASSTTAAPTTAADTVPPDLTDPLVPPDDNCPALDPAATSADLIVLADSVTWQGAEAPPCLRLLQPQSVRVSNATDFEVTASIGFEVLLVPPGGSANSVPAGESAQPGEVFDVYIEELDVSITVQVLAVPG